MEGNILKKLREDARKTQKQVALELGYHTTTYARWEQDVHNMKLIDVINIAKYFNVSIDYIAGLTDDPKQETIGEKERITIQQKNNIKAIVNIAESGGINDNQGT